MNKITLTAEYLPSSQNIEADWESHHTKDLTKWTLYPQTFARITQIMGTPSVDLFAPHLSHQLPQYMSWKLDTCCMYGSGCPATKMDTYIALCFSPIFSNRESFKENPRGQSYFNSHYFNMVVANLLLLKMSIKSPILLPAKNTLLMNPPWSTHPLLELGSLRLVAWLISSNKWRQREYLKRLQSSSQLPKGQVKKLVTNQPGISGLADLHRDKLSLFDAL